MMSLTAEDLFAHMEPGSVAVSEFLSLSSSRRALFLCFIVSAMRRITRTMASPIVAMISGSIRTFPIDFPDVVFIVDVLLVLIVVVEG